MLPFYPIRRSVTSLPRYLTDMSRIRLNHLTLSAIFLALGIILPLFIGQIPKIGSMLLPMHIPIFLCAFVCGYKYAVPVAIILPLLRSFLFGVPQLYPQAISIALEMATYALVSGIIYKHSRSKEIGAIYLSLIPSMVLGRAVRGAVQLSLLSLSGSRIAVKLFFTETIIAGIPGVLLQLIIIPAVMLILNRTKVINLDE